MDNYTKQTKEWLEHRFKQVDKDSVYFAHAPIYGYVKDHSERNITKRYDRAFKILTIINQLNFNSFLDIGGAEGFMTYNVRSLYKTSPAITSDLSLEANKRARELYNLDAITLDIHNLPFQDNSFDIVLCSETIEHIPKAQLAIQELSRVAKKYLIITTPRALSKKMQDKHFKNLKKDEKHAHINFFTQKDLKEILGDNTRFYGIRFFKIMEVAMAIIDGENLTRSRENKHCKILVKMYNLIKRVRCPKCFCSLNLNSSSKSLICQKCIREYRIRGGTIDFIS